MQWLTEIVFLCFLSVGYIYGQGEDFLGLPDFDVYALDFRNEELFQDRDIFNDDPEPLAKATEEAIERLCAEYDILLENHHVDCKKLKLVKKALNIDQHNVQKREAEDEVPLEGSGEGEGEDGVLLDLTPIEETKNETEPGQAEQPPVAEAEIEQTAENTKTSSKEAVPASATDPLLVKEDVGNAEPQPDQPVEQLTALEAETQKETENTEVPSEIKVEVPDTVTDVQEIIPDETKIESEGNVASEKPSENESVPSETEQAIPEATEKQSVAVPLDTKINESPEATELSPTEVPTVSNAEPSELPQEPKEIAAATVVPVDEVQKAVTENPVTQEAVATGVPGGIKKKGRILRPDVSPSEAPKEPEKETETSANRAEEIKPVDAPKEAENLNEQQSGNAIIDGVDAGTLEASDNAVKKMATNAKIKEASPDPEEPKSGESATETQQSRKDTKILIVLFVAVVVIGAAAFAYNFIKKRKQKKDEEPREENGGGNALKRSLQNLTGSVKTDPEQGTELKPLMNSDQKPVVTEYADERPNVKTEESK